MANKKRQIQMTAAALFMAVSLSACSGAAGGSAADDSAEEQEAKSDDEVLDEYAESITGTLKEHYGDNFKVERDGLFVNASVWKDGITDLVEAAAGGDEAKKEEWAKEVSDLEALSKDLGAAMEATGVKNGHAVLSIMDEESQQRMFAMLSDGVVIFDEVKASEETEAAESEETEGAAEETTEENTEDNTEETEGEAEAGADET